MTALDPRTARERPVWWWLSFADGEKPKGEQFLGVAVVKAINVTEAIREAWRLGINPGGECAFQELAKAPPRNIRRRLLSREEASKY